MPLINRIGGGASADLQEKTASPKVITQVIEADSGYDGLKKVTINPIYLQHQTVYPSTRDQDIYPDGGYDGFSGVTVKAMKLQDKTVVPSNSTQIITADSGYDALSGVVISAAAGGRIGGQNVYSATSQDGKGNSIFRIDEGTVDANGKVNIIGAFVCGDFTNTAPYNNMSVAMFVDFVNDYIYSLQTDINVNLVFKMVVTNISVYNGGFYFPTSAVPLFPAGYVKIIPIYKN